MSFYCETCCHASEREGSFTMHTRSLGHRKAKLIRAMLEQNCFRFTEIGGRVGLTRERVRQIALRMGFESGFERMKACTLAKQPSEALVAPSKFFIAAAARGFIVQPISRRSGFVNGKFCVERNSCLRSVGNRGHLYDCIHLARPKMSFDVCAWELPDGSGRFLILPDELVGFTTTYFRLEENSGNRKGAYENSHYYREYIERWSVLGETADKIPGSAQGLAVAG